MFHQEFNYTIVPDAVLKADSIINNHPIRVDMNWVNYRGQQYFRGHLNVLSEDSLFTEQVYGFMFNINGDELIHTYK